MAIAPRAGQILADLRVAVGHQATCEPSRLEGRKFFPATGGGKTIQPEQGSAVEDDMADLHHAGEADQLRFIDFIATQQFDIVAKVAQEPVELPQGFGVAIEAAGNDMVGKSTGFQDG